MTRRRIVLPITLLILFGGCAAATTGGGTGRDRNRITRQEIQALSATSIYQAIQILRPAMLQPRSAGMDGMRLPVLYVDGIQRPDISALRRIPAETVIVVEYMDGPQATLRFGTGHPAGALLVTTRSG